MKTLGEHWEAKGKAATIQNAIGFFIDKECLRCGAFLELPSLEDIQNWLEENEQ